MSSSSANPAHSWRNISYATAYKFHKEAQADVVREFSSRVSSSAECSYNAAKDIFQVLCLPGEMSAAFAALVYVVDEYVRKQHSEGQLSKISEILQLTGEPEDDFMSDNGSDIFGEKEAVVPVTTRIPPEPSPSVEPTKIIDIFRTEKNHTFQFLFTPLKSSSDRSLSRVLVLPESPLFDRSRLAHSAIVQCFKLDQKTGKYVPMERKITPLVAPETPSVWAYIESHVYGHIFQQSKDTATEDWVERTQGEIGQILLHGIPRAEFTKLMKWNSAEQVLNEARERDTRHGAFTPLLTSRVEDMDALLGRLGLDEASVSSRETYWELTFRLPDGSEVTMNIDAVGRKAPIAILEERLLELTYQHHPQRVFDARQVKLRQHQGPVSSVPSGHEVLASVFVAQTEGELLPVLKLRDAATLRLEGVRLKESALFQYPQSTLSMLKATKVYDLILERHIARGAEESVVTAYASGEEVMVVEQRLWFELSVELSDDGNAPSILGSIVQKMDAVGFMNRGPAADY